MAQERIVLVPDLRMLQHQAFRRCQSCQERSKTLFIRIPPSAQTVRSLSPPDIVILANSRLRHSPVCCADGSLVNKRRKTNVCNADACFSYALIITSFLLFCYGRYDYVFCADTCFAGNDIFDLGSLCLSQIICLYDHIRNIPTDRYNNVCKAFASSRISAAHSFCVMSVSSIMLFTASCFALSGRFSAFMIFRSASLFLPWSVPSSDSLPQ